MKINKEELLNALGKTMPGVSEKGLVEGSENFIFTLKKIVTYNDHVCVLFPFKTDFKCLVPASEFLNVVSNIKEDNIDIELKEETLLIKSETTKAKLATKTNESMLSLISSLGLKKVQWQNLPEDFLDGVKLCSFSVLKQLTRRFLSCIYVEGNKIVGSDSHRISLYEMKGKVKDSFLINHSVFSDLFKFSFIEYGVGESWVYFKDEDDLIFCFRRETEEYPDVEKFFGIEGKKIRLPKELKKIVDGVSFFAEGEIDIDRKIKVLVENETIKCKGEKQVGWVEKEIPLKYKGKPFSFLINPNFFCQILEHSTVMICGEDRAEFISGNFKHVLMFFME